MADHLANQGDELQNRPTKAKDGQLLININLLRPKQKHAANAVGYFLVPANVPVMKETVQALITMNLNFTITHVGSAPKPFPTRKLRNAHQQTCQGDSEANLNCRYCNKSFETNKQRINHEGLCPDKQAHSRSPILWECPRCSWAHSCFHISNLVSWPKPKEDITHTARARKKPTVPVVSAANKWKNMPSKVWAHESRCVSDETGTHMQMLRKNLQHQSWDEWGHEKTPPTGRSPLSSSAQTHLVRQIAQHLFPSPPPKKKKKSLSLTEINHTKKKKERKRRTFHSWFRVGTNAL